MVKQTKIGDKPTTRNFIVTRKIFLANYNPRRKYESEQYSVEADSFEEANKVIRSMVTERIAELKGSREIKTKE